MAIEPSHRTAHNTGREEAIRQDEKDLSCSITGKERLLWPLILGLFRSRTLQVVKGSFWVVSSNSDA